MTEEKKSIRARFLELGESIRDWLTSDEVTYKVINLNKKYGFTDDLISAIPFLITRLVVKDLNPEDLGAALEKQLDIDEKTATQILEEINSKILKPIAGGLHNAGVKLSSISKSIGGAESASQIKEILEPAVSFEANLAPSALRETASVEEEKTEEKKPIKEEVSLGTAPVIIHQEKPLFTPEAPREKPSVSFEPPRSRTFRQKPVSAKIEEPEGKEKSRIVHYSNFRTPLDKTDAKDSN